MHSRQVWRSVGRVWCDQGVESGEGTFHVLCACMLQRAGLAGQDSELTSHTFCHPSATHITLPSDGVMATKTSTRVHKHPHTYSHAGYHSPHRWCDGHQDLHTCARMT